MTDVTFVLTGPHKGKTVNLGGRFPFRDGRWTFSSEDQRSVGNVATYLARCYQAFPEGQVPADADVAAAAVAVNAPVAVVEEHTEPFQDPLADAVRSLNPDREEDWTREGLPRVDRVNELYAGEEEVTRDDITNAVPGFNRDAAKDTPRG